MRGCSSLLREYVMDTLDLTYRNRWTGDAFSPAVVRWALGPESFSPSDIFFPFPIRSRSLVVLFFFFTWFLDAIYSSRFEKGYRMTERCDNEQLLVRKSMSPDRISQIAPQQVPSSLTESRTNNCTFFFNFKCETFCIDRAMYEWFGKTVRVPSRDIWSREEKYMFEMIFFSHDLCQIAFEFARTGRSRSIWRKVLPGCSVIPLPWRNRQRYDVDAASRK